MARDKIGSFMEVGECCAWLNNWINHYVVPNPENAGETIKAGEAAGRGQGGGPCGQGQAGLYEAVAYLRPHFQLEALSASMRLVAEVPKKG